MQLLSPKEEGSEISSLFVDETVELDETESMEGDKEMFPLDFRMLLHWEW